MEKRCVSDECAMSRGGVLMMAMAPTSPTHSDRCLGGRLHLRSGMKLIIAIGTLVLAALIVALSLYFRKALFMLAIPAMVVVFASGAVFSARSSLCLAAHWNVGCCAFAYNEKICVLLFFLPENRLFTHRQPLKFTRSKTQKHLKIR